MNPDKLDAMLAYLLAQLNTPGDEEIGKAIGEPTYSVRKGLRYIAAEYPTLLKIEQFNSGYVAPLVRKEHREAITDFLAEGGFTAIHQAILKNIEQETESTKQVQTLNQLQIEALEKQPGQIRRANRIAIAAIIVALLALFLEVLKTWIDHH